MDKNKQIAQLCGELESVGMSGKRRRLYYANKLFVHDNKALHVTGVSFLETGAIKIRYFAGTGIVKSFYIEPDDQFVDPQPENDNDV